MGRIEKRANQTGPPSPWSGPEVGAQVASQHCPILRSGHFQCSCPLFNPWDGRTAINPGGRRGQSPPSVIPLQSRNSQGFLALSQRTGSFGNLVFCIKMGTEGAECKNES